MEQALKEPRPLPSYGELIETIYTAFQSKRSYTYTDENGQSHIYPFFLGDAIEEITVQYKEQAMALFELARRESSLTPADASSYVDLVPSPREETTWDEILLSLSYAIFHADLRSRYSYAIDQEEKQRDSEFIG